MLSADPETIAAIATPPGRGGIGIIRISGPLSRRIAEQILGCLPAPRYAHYGPLCDADGNRLDFGIALFFPAPNSVTGEDVLELHAHGGPVLLDMLVEAALTTGARPAKPGEFSERAFLNGKIDLSQAEAVADLIDGESRAAVKNAARSLGGALSRQVAALGCQLTALRTRIEAALNFDEEADVPGLIPVAELRAEIDSALSDLERVRNAAERGMARREARRVVLCGHPNVGKSSLLNALCGEDAAIVSPQPGTTRDVVRAELQESGCLLQLVDTAGLHDSDEDIELESMARTRRALADADHILQVVDSSAPPVPALGVPILGDQSSLSIVENKCDLSGARSGLVQDDSDLERIRVSALRGDGIDELRALLARQSRGHSVTEGEFSARRRHVECMERVADSLQRARSLAQLDSQLPEEEIAEWLATAHRQLGEIAGEFDDEALLGEIFSRFCVGK